MHATVCVDIHDDGHQMCCVAPPGRMTSRHASYTTYLGQRAKGKHGARQLCLGEAAQKVGLILHGIWCQHQLHRTDCVIAAEASMHSCIVAGGDAIKLRGMLCLQVIIEGAEFDPVAAEAMIGAGDHTG